MEYPALSCICNINHSSLDEYPQLVELLSRFKGRRVGIEVRDFGKINGKVTHKIFD
jgi:hypothetical protein